MSKLYALNSRVVSPAVFFRSPPNLVWTQDNRLLTILFYICNFSTVLLQYAAETRSQLLLMSHLWRQPFRDV